MMDIVGHSRDTAKEPGTEKMEGFAGLWRKELRIDEIAYKFVSRVDFDASRLVNF